MILRVMKRKDQKVNKKELVFMRECKKKRKRKRKRTLWL